MNTNERNPKNRSEIISIFIFIFIHFLWKYFQARLSINKNKLNCLSKGSRQAILVEKARRRSNLASDKSDRAILSMIYFRKQLSTNGT